jgi:hypothetical protein
MNQARFIYDNVIELGLKPDDWFVASLTMHYDRNQALFVEREGEEERGSGRDSEFRV